MGGLCLYLFSNFVKNDVTRVLCLFPLNLLRVDVFVIISVQKVVSAQWLS